MEVLIALVIGGLVTLGVSLALRTGLDAQQRLRERADAHAEARAVMERLTADLSAAFLSGVNTAETSFTAEPAETVEPGEPFLSFTTLSYRRSVHAGMSRGVGARSDTVQVDYALEPVLEGERETAALIRRERWATERGDGEPEVLCERIGQLRLRFMGDGEWERGWDAGAERNPPLAITEGEEPVPEPSRRRLPRAVEVTLLLAPASNESTERLSRLYRTVVLVGADGVAPFETQVNPAQPGSRE